MFFWSCSNIGIGNPRSDRGCLCIWEAPQTQATTMEAHGSPSAGRPCPVDLAKTNVVVAMSKGDELEREYFINRIAEMEEEEFGKTTKERPLPHIVKYHGKVQHSFAIPLY